MPQVTNISRGLPVEVGRIDHELKRLWEESGAVATRASLINFAVYCEGAEALEKNTELISRFTRNHACRAILIAAVRDTRVSRVQAWISAHCQLTRAGAKQVCCEQITFLIEGDAQTMIPNIVFAHLDSDLPLYLWWQSSFPESMDSQLWSWVDRLIFDSHIWSDPQREFRGLEKLRAGRTTLCDLNWSRVYPFRNAIAQIFDDPECAALLDDSEAIILKFGPGFRATAVLLSAWLMAQLGWSVERAEEERFILVSKSAPQQIELKLVEQAGVQLGACEIEAGAARFCISTDPASDLLHVDVWLGDERHFCRLLPAGRTETLDLLNHELMRGGTHHIYLKTLQAAGQLL